MKNLKLIINVSTGLCTLMISSDGIHLDAKEKIKYYEDIGLKPLEMLRKLWFDDLQILKI